MQTTDLGQRDYHFQLLRGIVIVAGLAIALVPGLALWVLPLFLLFALVHLYWVVRHVEDPEITFHDRVNAYHLILIELALGFVGVGIHSVALAFFMISAIYLAYTCRRYEMSKDVPARQHGLAALQYVAILFLMIIVFARAYQEHGLLHANNVQVPESDHFTHLYFSMVTWTTLGFGDFKPTADAQAWAALEGLCGYVFLGLFLLIIPSLLRPKELHPAQARAGEPEPGPASRSDS